MKNSLKKAFILLLSFAMVFTLMAMPVYAEGSGENEGQALSFDKEDSIKVYPKGTFGEDPEKMPETAFRRQYAIVTDTDLKASRGDEVPEIELSVNDGILSWTPVEGAEAYQFEIVYEILEDGSSSAYAFFLEEYDNGSFDVNAEIDHLIRNGDIEKPDDGNYSVVLYASDDTSENIAETRWTYHYDSEQEYIPPEELTVTVTDSVLSWSSVEGAESYNLYINDVYARWMEDNENGDFDIDDYIDISIKYGRIDKAEDGIYLLEIVAYDGHFDKIGVGKLAYHYETDSVYEGEAEVNAWVEGGAVCWEPVEDANHYEIVVEGEDSDHGVSLEEEENGDYDLDGFIDHLIRQGDIEKPEDNNYNVVLLVYDEFGYIMGRTEFTYHYESAAEYVEPAEITLTVNSGMLSWTEVQDTDYYVLYVDGWGNEISDNENGSYDVNDFIDRQIENGSTEKAEDGIYSLEVNAYNSQSDLIGSGTMDYYYESDAEYKEPVKMDLTVKDGLLSWTDVEDAQHYELLINGDYERYLISNENGTYNINEAIEEGIKRGYLVKPEDNVYKLTIQAIEYYGYPRGEGSLNYTYETEADYIKPEDITARIEGGMLYWDEVEGAAWYDCSLEGIYVGNDGLSADLRGVADALYTRGMIDGNGRYSVSVTAYDTEGYEKGFWEGTFEYTPEKTEIKQIKEIEISDINTNIREGKKVEFTTKVGTQGVDIAEQFWSAGEGEELGEHSDRLPAKGDVLNFCLILRTDWDCSFADTENIVIKYNGKVIKPYVSRFSDRFVGLYNMVPPVVIGNNDSQRISRIAGSDRYQTAFMAADRLKKELGVERFENIVIASGTNFPDALAGAYLAKVKNAPILLVRKQNAAAVADYVKKNMEAKGTVYILGGTGAVPSDMETALKAQGLTKTKRLQGANRYLTNIEILKEAGVRGEDILVCAGGGYADSLSASATGRPVLLVGGKLLPEQKEYLESIKSKISGNVYAIGGTGAVSEPVFKEVCAYATGEKARVAGDTRYTTSKAVADKFFPAVHNTVVLAYAQNYPDGLAGGPVAYAMNSPLLLVTSSKKEAAATYAKAHGSVKCLVLGGPTLISDAAALAIVK